MTEEQAVYGAEPEAAPRRTDLAVLNAKTDALAVRVADIEDKLEVLAASQVTPADVARLQDQQLAPALASSAVLVDLRRIADALETLSGCVMDRWSPDNPSNQTVFTVREHS